MPESDRNPAHDGPAGLAALDVSTLLSEELSGFWLIGVGYADRWDRCPQVGRSRPEAIGVAQVMLDSAARPLATVVVDPAGAVIWRSWRPLG